jgi:hypothetical protein
MISLENFAEWCMMQSLHLISLISFCCWSLFAFANYLS